MMLVVACALVACSATLRNALQSLFAVLVSVFAFDLVLLCTLTCAVGALVLMSSDKPRGWTRPSPPLAAAEAAAEAAKAAEAAEAAEAAAAAAPAEATSRKRGRLPPRRIATQALFGALMSTAQPAGAQAQMGQLMSLGATRNAFLLCSGDNIREWAVHVDADGLAVDFVDVTVICPWLLEPRVAVEKMRLHWTASTKELSCEAPPIRLGNKLADPCLLAVASLDPLRRIIMPGLDLDGDDDPDAADAYLNHKDEWKQILIFIICFLGVGAVLEALMIVFMPISLTRCLRDQLGDGAAPRRLRSASATSPLEECFVGSSGASASSLLLEPVHDALARTRRIPKHAQILVPLFIVGCIALFASANKAIGASVDITVEYDHKPFWPPWRHHEDWTEHFYGPYNVFAFSLVNTVTEMYQAGVYILALLVLVWSGIWPYLKLILLLFCWVAPAHILSAKLRGSMLVVFDALGKWCMIDIFLMVMMSVAFRFHVESSEVPYMSWLLPRDFLVLDVAVGSHWGLFGFMLAAITSILLGHVILGYHRTAVASQVSELLLQRLYVIDEEGGAFEEGDEEEEDEVDNCARQESGISIGRRLRGPGASEEAALLEAEAALLARAISAKPRARRYCCSCPEGSYFNVGSDELPVVGRIAAIANRKEAVADATSLPTKLGVTLALVATFALILAGALADSFEFTFTGTAARAIRIVQPESAVRRYSLVSIAAAIDPGDDVIDPPPQAGIIFMQTVYLLFAMVMPLVQCVFLLALWLVPMRLRDQKIVMMVTELISAFSALDCFIVSIIAACVEIDQFAVFLAGDHCDKLEEYTKEPCFGIQTAFLPGCWVTMVAAASLFTVNQLVVRLCDQILRDRELDPLLFQ